MSKRSLVAAGIILILVLVVANSYREKMPFRNLAMAPQYAAMDAGLATDAVMERSAASKGMAVGRVGIAPPMPTPGYQTGGGDEFRPTERLVVKTGNMSVVVEDVEKAIDDTIKEAQTRSGFEVSRNVYKDSRGGLVGEVTVRVPAKDFDATIGVIRGFGEVERSQVNGQDVTEQYVDVQAQLKNLRATEEQYLEILKRAQKVEEILQVQQYLSSIRGQIESLEGQKRYIEETTSMSLLTVYFSTDPASLPVVEPENQWKPVVVVKEALRELLNVGKGIVNALIWFVIFTPVWLALGLIVWFAVRMYRRHS